jgi:hypothetical protein
MQLDGDGAMADEEKAVGSTTFTKQVVAGVKHHVTSAAGDETARFIIHAGEEGVLKEQFFEGFEWFHPVLLKPFAGWHWPLL